ncbi:hypothetical protein HY992_00975 [Candidatus Micrarchaeota archaeon]|nr:hypothetical protein [Candidatus Micrarchaeota archaeon]
MSIQQRILPAKLKQFQAIASAGGTPAWFARALGKEAEFDPERALSKAIRNTDAPLVGLLLSAGAGVAEDAQRKLKLNARLIDAVKKMNVDGVERMLCDGADANCRDRGVHVLVIAFYGMKNEKMRDADKAACHAIYAALNAHGAVVPASEAEQAGL